MEVSGQPLLGLITPEERAGGPLDSRLDGPQNLAKTIISCPAGNQTHNHKIKLIALTKEAASTSEMFVNFYQTTRRYNPEDSHLHTRRRENLKSYIKYKLIDVVLLGVSGLKMETVCFSETLVSTYESASRHDPEHRLPQRRKNLKSHI
jgi:hypothetical protein